MNAIVHATTLRQLTEKDIEKERTKRQRNRIYFLLENVYDTYNIGALFRLADAAGVDTVFLSGDMEIPPNRKISNASIGTDRIVPWEYYPIPEEAIAAIRLREPELAVIGIELHPRALPYTVLDYREPTLFVLGNESTGISEKTLESCNAIVQIPMYGVNKSLNVIVAAGVVLYHALQSGGILSAHWPGRVNV